MRPMRCWLAALCLACVTATSLGAEPGPGIKRIYLIHFSHTDVGFTDMPGVCRELQRRYLDIAIDAVLASRNGPPANRFHWTCESLLTVTDWWEAASPARRQDFLTAVQSGQMDISALPCNQAPMLNAVQWRTMLHWLSDELWTKLKPTVALQNDVNGFPRAGAMALLDRGVTRLCMGINADSGGPPLPRPGGFWWKMPDGRRMFVWLNYSYPEGYDFFETVHWRRGPVPFAADTRYRPPGQDDFFRTDETSLRKAQAQCQRRVESLRRAGYPHEVLTISMTNHWRMDNDPPFLPLANFVAAWNKLGLTPELVFTTASRAMEAMQKEIGPRLPEYQGEFTDWWANGAASSPREVAASRQAKRWLAAASSPLWEAMPTAGAQKADSLYRDLCLFDEHTWGSSWSVSEPGALDSQAQFAEKAMLAWRPYGQSQWLLSQRARTHFGGKGPGLYVANTSAKPYSGWVHLPANCLRGDFHSVRDLASGRSIPLEYRPGVGPWTRPRSPEEMTRANTAATFPDNVPDQAVRFWLDGLPAQASWQFELLPDAATPPRDAPAPHVVYDASGWPTSAQWPGMARPLFEAGLGDFTAAQIDGTAPRWILKDLCAAGSTPRGDELRSKHVRLLPAQADGSTRVSSSPHTIEFAQWLAHPRLRWAERRLELWRREARARLTFRLHRIGSEAPEAFYIGFPLACDSVLPRVSNGGMPFTPFADQLPGTCRDHLAIDGWADYATGDGHWFWVSRDAPLISFERPQIWTRRQSPPQKPQQLLAMVYNNFWYTNFLADQPGTMEFQFDLVWRQQIDKTDDAMALADALVAEPVVLINPATHADAIVRRRLFAPD